MICPKDQVRLLNKVLLNIYSSFIPNKIETVRPHQGPWLTQAVRNFLRKNRAYKSFMRRGRPDDKLDGIQKMISESARLIEEAKRNYFFKAGKTLAISRTSSKTYWYLMNTVLLNKASIPLIPPLLENGLFVLNFAEKGQIFNDHLVYQCTPINKGSELPQDFPVTTTSIIDFVISEEKILSIIRSLSPNKAHGWGEISVRMIKMSDDALVLPLKTIS